MAGEGVEGGCEAVLALAARVGLDPHEGGEAVDGGHDRLGRGRGVIAQRRNEILDGRDVVLRGRVDACEEAREGEGVLVVRY